MPPTEQRIRLDVEPEKTRKGEELQQDDQLKVGIPDLSRKHQVFFFVMIGASMVLGSAAPIFGFIVGVALVVYGGLIVIHSKGVLD